VAKKGRALKEKLVALVRENLDKFSHVFVFEVHNMRNAKFKELREEWKPSRFLMGKNRVMQVALGRSRETEFKKNLFRLGALLKAERGLLFTDRCAPLSPSLPRSPPPPSPRPLLALSLSPHADPPRSDVSEVREYFSRFSSPSFARSGFVSPRTVRVPGGPLNFPVSMEPFLRKLGLPTRIVDAKLVLPSATRVCSKGEALSPEQCKILELFGVKLAHFRIDVVGAWSDGSFADFSAELADAAAAHAGDADEEAAHEGAELRLAPPGSARARVAMADDEKDGDEEEVDEKEEAEDDGEGDEDDE
jgi:mRNA turnover protein 4